MFAVIETGGKQYKVQNGDVIYVEKLAAEDNSEISFQVVALGGEDGLKVGTPYVDGASVTGKVLKTGKGKKITVFTYKPKKGEKRAKGHFTLFRVVFSGRGLPRSPGCAMRSGHRHRRPGHPAACPSA